MSRNQEYVEQYAEYAMEQMRRYGIPASVTLAQGICESASGQSELSRFLRHSQIFEQLFVLINTKEVFWNMQALKYR